jgi:hypothetical protein
MGVFLVGTLSFSLHHHVQSMSGTQSIFCPVVVLKECLDYEADYTFPSSFKVENTSSLYLSPVGKIS